MIWDKKLLNNDKPIYFLHSAVIALWGLKKYGSVTLFIIINFQIMRDDFNILNDLRGFLKVHFQHDQTPADMQVIYF